MNKVLRVVIILVVVLLMVGLVVKRKKHLKSIKPYGVRPLAVHVADVTEQSLESAHSYLGVVEAWQVANISSRMSAKVDVVSHNEGDIVKADEMLLHLDDSDIQAQIKALESTIQSLKINRDFWVKEDQRDSKLSKDGVISSVEAESTHNKMTTAVAQLKAAQQSLDSMMTKLAYTQLKSPFNGQVTVRNVDPGDLATPGRILMVVEDLSSLKISFDAPQEDMEFLKKGLPVNVKIAGKMMALNIARVYPSLNKSRMVRVEVKVPAEDGMVTGSFIPLKVVLQEHTNAITIPRESLMKRGINDWVVFTVVDGKLKLTAVQKVMESGGRIEVSGLKPGEQVIISTFLGWANLSDGLKVEVVK